MFANNNLGVVNIGFPDVCLVAEVPVPEVNVDFSITNIPTVFNVLFGPGLAENLLTVSALSTADLGIGVVSGMCLGPKRSFLGSFKTIVGCMFASRLTSINGQNGLVPNTVGMSLTPAQFKVILLT
ncbi:MAG TPA: PAAR-like domain-containing protein [Rhodocyclaceae bacterium]|nr:PAAR-like domain-containing protein [Rhodocyclaceae bacterium]